MIQFLSRFLLLSLVTCSPLQLEHLPTSNASSVASDKSPILNATRLGTYNETYNDCFGHDTGHIFMTTKSDCERALDKIVKGKSLTEVHSFGYQSRGVTDRLPLEAEYGSCTIVLMMFDLDTRISLTYAEIYAEILGPDGLLKECLGPSVPKEDALGGQTVLGPRNMMIVDVTGRPRGATDQNSR